MNKIKVSYVQTHSNGDRELCYGTLQAPIVKVDSDTVYRLVCSLPGRLGWTPIREGLSWTTILGT